MSYTKVEYVEAITAELRGKGKRMTNLNKASIKQLQEIAKKYGIDEEYMETFRTRRKQQRKQDKEAEMERQEKKRKEAEERTHRRWIETKIINSLKKHLPLETIKNKYITTIYLKEHLHGINNATAIANAKDFQKRSTAIMAEKLNGTVEGDGCIRAWNGIVVHNSFMSFDGNDHEPLTVEYITETYDDDYGLRRLYPYGILDNIRLTPKKKLKITNPHQ